MSDRKALVLRQLTDVDGSARDITLPRVSAERALGLLRLLEDTAQFRSGTWSESGEAADLAQLEAWLMDPDGLNQWAFTSWSEHVLFRDLQLAFSREQPENFFVELTFFPQDLNADAFTMTTFLEFLGSVREASGTRLVWVRYENASWKPGDETQPDSGVILGPDEHAGHT